MIALIENMSAQRTKELRAEGAAQRRAARARRNSRRAGAAGDGSRQLAIRRIDPAGADRIPLEEVAGRDSAPPPSGDVIGAEVDGRLVAALSLSSGELVSDPFVPTAEARSALRLRAIGLRAVGDAPLVTDRRDAGEGRLIARP